MKITECPTCGSRRIARVKRPFEFRFKGKPIAIPDLEREVCPDCGEELFGPEANRRIEQEIAAAKDGKRKKPQSRRGKAASRKKASSS